jgi:hypothetical protein
VLSEIPGGLLPIPFAAHWVILTPMKMGV